MIKLIGLLLSFTIPLSCSAPAADMPAHLEFVCEGKKIEYFDSKIAAPDHTVAEEIEKRMINAPLKLKLRQVEKCLQAGATMKNAVLYSFPLLGKTVDGIMEKYNVPAKDSEIRFRPASTPMFEITKAKAGTALCERKIYEDIFFSLKKNPHAVIAIKPADVEPAVTEKENSRLTYKLASFSTGFASSNENRRHNIALALSRINGYVLMPGKQFSFNGTVGPRSAACGFKTAKIIVDGEYKEGTGGGVCQASTTLYNAALLADLKVDAARNHSLAPSYVPPSFDAMVNASGSDLRFTNTRKTPVFLRCYTAGDEAKVEVYGEPLGYKITTESVVVSRGEPLKDKEFIDYERKYTTEQTPPSSKIRVYYGHGALKSEGYVVKKDLAGNELERKLIRRDTYSPSAGLVAVPPPLPIKPDTPQTLPALPGQAVFWDAG